MTNDHSEFDSPQTAGTGSPHRWYSFRFRSWLIFALAAFSSFAIFYAKSQSDRKQQEQAMIDRVIALGGTIQFRADAGAASDQKRVDDVREISFASRSQPRARQSSPTYVVDDISALVHFENLESLDLRGTQATDLAPLAELKSLKKLVTKNHVPDCDISSIATLVALEELDLGATEVSDLTPLQHLVNLRKLRLRLRPDFDPTPLRQLKNLDLIEFVPSIDSSPQIPHMVFLKRINEELGDSLPHCKFEIGKGDP